MSRCFASRTSLVVVALVASACAAPRVQPADAQRMIESHPRFSEPQVVRLPARYCGVPPEDVPPPLPPTDIRYTPPQDPNHVNALQAAGVIRVAHRRATADECEATKRDLFTVTLTPAGEGFHPVAVEGGGWQFVLAQRKFVKLQDVTYDDPDNPKIAHVQYVWTWVPTLLGQLLQVGSVPQGASATFLRDGNGWIVRQPGM